jgi:Xaa-Pro aminopeptidase
MLDMSPIPEVVGAFGIFYRECPRGTALTRSERMLHPVTLEGAGYDSAHDALAAVLRTLGLKRSRIWLDESGLLEGDRAAIGAACPDYDFRSAAQHLRSIRRVKTPDEIRCLQRAARVTEAALNRTAHAIEAGVTEVDVARHFEGALVAEGGRPIVTLVRFGRNGVAGQVRPSSHRLGARDTIWCDVMTTVDGYWADIARTYVIGEPNSRVSQLYAGLRSAMDAGLAAAKPGVTTPALYDLVVRAARADGIPHYRRHHVGHGIGLELYEEPLIAPGAHNLIAADEVISLEAPYYEFGLGALHIEDPVWVCQTGGVRLTSGDRGLTRVG